MAYQGFIGKLFIKNANKQEFTWLSTHVTVVFEISIANFYILDSFLADMCIFPFLTNFVTMDFFTCHMNMKKTLS
jgi:hypothetical protein